MISVETKTFETGVMRLLGLSKMHCISLIIFKGLIFVIPSVIFGYATSIIALKFIYSILF